MELDLNGSILFDSGNAEIKDNSKLFLQKIAQILVKYKYNVIEIEGHTDNTQSQIQSMKIIAHFPQNVRAVFMNMLCRRSIS